MLHTIQLFFMRSRCSRVTTFLFPGSKGRCWVLSVRTERRVPGTEGHTREKRHARCIMNSPSRNGIGGKTAQCTATGRALCSKDVPRLRAPPVQSPDPECGLGKGRQSDHLGDSPSEHSPQDSTTLTCAGDHHVHLPDDFTELHHPEPVHAGGTGRTLSKAGGQGPEAATNRD